MNQSFLQDILSRDVHVVLFGAVEARPRLQLHESRTTRSSMPATATATTPKMRSTVHTGRIVPFYEKAGTVTPNMQRRLVFEVLSTSCRRDLPDPFPDDMRRAPAVCPTGARRSTKRTFPPAGTSGRRLNAFRTPAQRRLIFEEFFLFQLGPDAAQARGGARAKPRTIHGRRSHPRIGARDAAVQADGRAAERAEGDRRRHAAADADEPPAAGRRRRRQDDRRAAGGAWWRWRTACRWRSWRRPKFSPSSTSCSHRGSCSSDRASASSC